MESHIVTRLASISVDTCAACVVMNARAIAMAIQPDDEGDSWMPMSAVEYAGILMRVIRIRMAMEATGRNGAIVSVLSALEDDGIAIYATFLTTEAEKRALSMLRDSLRVVMPEPAADPATAVFNRVQEMRAARVPDDPWLHWRR